MSTAKPGPGQTLSRWLQATPEQAKDTGMAMVLICLLLGSWGKFPQFLPVSIVLLLITMVWPQAFKPLAALWFGLSHLLSQVVSRVLLTIVFFGLVTPIGVIRRWRGADALQLKKWKQGQDSVFVTREGPVQSKDLMHPY
jgi:polyferredoxin